MASGRRVAVLYLAGDLFACRSCDQQAGYARLLSPLVLFRQCRFSNISLVLSLACECIQSMVMLVRDIIRERKQTGSRRGFRTDPHHLALVIEGGGMRGVVSAGMVAALEARNLTNCFDSIHGSSAGACAGAYFLAGQAGLGARIYYEDINNRHFIDLWGPCRGRPVMNTHFLIDHVMRMIKPLDTKRILLAEGVLHIVTTDARSGQGRSYSRFRDAEHFFLILKGSITIPAIAGRPVEVDGVRLVDGGMVEQIPLRCALSSSPSHILVLMTRKEGELERLDRPWRSAIEKLIMHSVCSGNLAAVYGRRNSEINEVLARIQNSSYDPVIESIARGASASNVGRLTIDGPLLKTAGDEGRRAVYDYLDS
jgi:predicted patatin/cPLA2 family phospholipase